MKNCIVGFLMMSVIVGALVYLLEHFLLGMPMAFYITTGAIGGCGVVMFERCYSRIDVLQRSFDALQRRLEALESKQPTEEDDQSTEKGS